VASRRSEPSTARRMFSGRLSRGAVPPGTWEIQPNFVASTTSSRRPLMARPTSSLFVNGPYASAVSMSVTPRSSARWIVPIASPSSTPAPVYAWDIPIVPNPMQPTSREPSLARFIVLPDQLRKMRSVVACAFGPVMCSTAEDRPYLRRYSSLIASSRS
jgi:hypothetical protein